MLQPEKLREDVERALTELQHEYRMLFYSHGDGDVWRVKTKKVIPITIFADFDLREELTYQDIKDRLSDMLSVGIPGYSNEEIEVYSDLKM